MSAFVQDFVISSFWVLERIDSTTGEIFSIYCMGRKKVTARYQVLFSGFKETLDTKRKTTNSGGPLKREISIHCRQKAHLFNFRCWGIPKWRLVVGVGGRRKRKETRRPFRMWFPQAFQAHLCGKQAALFETTYPPPEWKLTTGGFKATFLLVRS